MKHSNVLVLPSYREGFGSVVIEAAACGVPAIGSDIKGLVGSIKADQTGLLFPVGDVEELAKSMLKLFIKPSLCEKLGMRAEERAVSHFDQDLLVTYLEDFYASKLKPPVL